MPVNTGCWLPGPGAGLATRAGASAPEKLIFRNLLAASVKLVLKGSDVFGAIATNNLAGLNKHYLARATKNHLAGATKNY